MSDLLFNTMIALWYVGMLSYLWKAPNPLYELIEAIYIGVGSGHVIVAAILVIRSTGITPMTAGRWWMIIPIIIGALYLARLSTEYSWLSRYPVALTTGVGLGIIIGPALDVSVVAQVSGTLNSLVEASGPMELFSSLVLLIGVLTSIIYFVFTIEHKGYIRLLARVGLGFLFAAMAVNYTAELGSFIATAGYVIRFIIRDWLMGSIFGIG